LFFPCEKASDSRACRFADAIWNCGPSNGPGVAVASFSDATLTGIPGGATQYFKIAIWDKACPSPEAAAAAGSYSGQTAIFTAQEV
jgi:hypothetical protein